MSVLLLADNFGCATAWPTRMGVGIFRLLAAQESRAHSTARHRRDGHGIVIDASPSATPRQRSQAAPRPSDAALIDEALEALLMRHRSVEIDPSYAAYDEHPLDEPHEWGDHARSTGSSGSNETESRSLVAEH
jgi:hypothetical protein